MEFVEGWQAVATSAAILSMLLVGCAFAVGNLFANKRFIAWAKNEFAQALASALIIGGLLVFATALEDAASETAGKNHLLFAEDYVSSLNARISALDTSLVGLNMVVSALGKTSITINAVALSGSTQPLAGLSAVSQGIEFMLANLRLVRLSNDIQYWFLVFIQTTMFNYFLPIGVILRTFPLTRAVGGFMMALAIGTYIVFPLTYVLADRTVAEMNQEMDDATTQATELGANASTAMLSVLNLDALSSFVADLVNKTIWKAAGGVVSTTRKILADLFMQTIILPIISLVITLLFICQLNAFLGGDIGVRND